MQLRSSPRGNPGVGELADVDSTLAPKEVPDLGDVIVGAGFILDTLASQVSPPRNGWILLRINHNFIFSFHHFKYIPVTWGFLELLIY